MKNLKPHQKVVFKVARLRLPFDFYREMQPDKNFPAENEVVTIFKHSQENPGFYILREYPVNKRGTMQAISELVLFPLNEISKTETDKIIEEITQEIEQSNTVKI
jgi:hypothetical protein